MTHVRIDLRSLLALLLVSCAALACHDSHSQLVGSESHFLEACKRDSECGELRCITGMCTTACTEDAECDGLGADLSCQRERCDVQPKDAGPRAPKPVDGGTTGQAGDLGTTNTSSEGGPWNPIIIGGPDRCGQQSGFQGDDACLAPPAAGEGIQIHIGPNRYDDDEEVSAWLLQPGDEITKCWTFQMPAKDFAFAEWEVSARPSMHHSIHVLDMSDGRFDLCTESSGTVSTSTAIPDQLLATQPVVTRVGAAPENAAIARRIPAGAPAGASVHAFNYTDKPILIEVWLNLYKPREQPAQYDVPLLLGPGTNLMPDQDVARFTCPIGQAGRLLSLTALTLPSTHTVDVWLQHANGDRIQLLHRPYIEPEIEPHGATTFRFDSVTMNPPIASSTPGGFSGLVEIEAGDVLGWECQMGPLDPLGNLCDLAGSATVALDCQ